MKYILSLCLLGLPCVSKAQFMVGSTALTIQNGAVFTVDRLVLKPAADINIQNNQLQRSSIAIPAGSGNSIERVYLFTSPIDYSGTMGFSYENNELAGNSENTLNLLYSSDPNGNAWSIGNGSIVDSAINYITAVIPPVTISRLTASTATPLPVTLIDFRARKDASEQTGVLEWEIAHERNCKEYSVERSADAKTFVAIGAVPATGGSFYHLVDARPLEGNNYYRLKMIDFDGSYNYSDVRVLTFGKATVVFRVYPNPAKGESVTISTDSPVPGGMSLTVVDISGRVMHGGRLDGAQTQVNVSGWPGGTYLIKLSNGAAFPFVKQ